jgi:predicted permease
VSFDRPPRVVRWVLARLLDRGPGGWHALAELDEEFADRARGDRRSARRWYRREAWSMALNARSISGYPQPAVSQRGDSMFRRLFTEVRLSVRSLVKQPRFTLVATLTLALGIGAVTAIFSVVKGVLLEPLPYPNGNRLVNVWSMAPGLGYDQFPLSPDLFKHYRAHNTVFEDMALYQARRSSLGLFEGPEVVDSSVTTYGYFSTLGITLPLGRSYTADEDTPKGPRVVVMSHRLWQRSYGSDRGILGRVVKIDGETAEVVGVAPAWLDTPDSPDLWMPAKFPPEEYPAGTFGWEAVARLKPGVTTDQAAADLEPLVKQAMATIRSANYKAFLTDGRYQPRVHLLKDDIIGNVERPLWILLGTVGIVLLIACANVANLCLVRADARQREIGMRLALGANRATVVRTLMTEALVLGALGAAGGLLLAYLGLPALLRLAPASIPRLEGVRIDVVVLAVAAAAGVLAALVFGLVPALRYSRPSTLGALRQGGRSMTDQPGRHRGRSILVAVQTAMAMILLVGSGLLARSFVRMMNVDPGFDPNGLITARVTLPEATYPEIPSVARAQRQLVEGLSQLPGVTSAGATSDLPIGDSSSGTAFDVEGRPVEPGRLPPIVQFQFVTPGYFSTIRATMLQGRDLDWRDTTNVVVNRTTASQLWPNQDPIGRRLRRTASENARGTPAWHTVIGVVGDIRQDGLRQPAPGQLYFPAGSEFDGPVRSMTYVIRGTATTANADTIRRTVRSLDPSLPVASIRTVRDIVRQSVVEFSFTMFALAIAAGVALILGTIGLYSVLSYAVSLQTREIGLRLALGAPPARVMRAIVSRGAVICGVGLVVGSVGAFGVTRLLQGLLFETTPLDPLTFAATALALVVVTLLASYVPARRAASISPMESMRAD